MDNLIKLLEERQQVSEKYWEETYPDDTPIHNAEETDNQSWEIGFWWGIQYALDQLNQEIARDNAEKFFLRRRND